MGRWNYHGTGRRPAPAPHLDYSIRLATKRDYEPIIDLNLKDSNIPLKNNLTIFEKFEAADWWSDKGLLNWHFSLLSKINGGILIIETEDGNVIGELDFLVETNFNLKKIHIYLMLNIHEKKRPAGLSRRP